MLINKEDLQGLGLLNRQEEIVDVPEWGEGRQVKVVELSALDRTALFLEVNFDADGKAKNDRKKKTSENVGLTYQVLAKCLVDNDDQPLFSHEELCVIKGKHFAVLDRLVMVALRLNGLTNQEEKVKNSDPSLGDSSPSVSA